MDINHILQLNLRVVSKPIAFPADVNRPITVGTSDVNRPLDVVSVDVTVIADLVRHLYLFHLLELLCTGLRPDTPLVEHKLVQQARRQGANDGTHPEHLCTVCSVSNDRKQRFKGSVFIYNTEPFVSLHH